MKNAGLDHPAEQRRMRFPDAPALNQGDTQDARMRDHPPVMVPLKRPAKTPKLRGQDGNFEGSQSC